MELDETNNPNSNTKRHRSSMSICNGSGLGPITGNTISKVEDELDEDSRKRIMPWSSHPSSRIYRVSRASGGKDRHSKVYTAKGIRDRRVRLSVSTAIQFYDLQDRLGYDQPSKAIEWLIKAASNAIDKLPSLDHSSFPMDNSMSKYNRTVPDQTEPDPDQTGFNNNNQLTKSGCSSTSETSKGSVLSLSRSENRVKARERARERTKDKEKSQDDTPTQTNHNGGNNASFTELLTGASSHGCNTGPSSSVHLPTATVLTTADYFKINHTHTHDHNHNNHNHNHNNHHNHNHNHNHQQMFSSPQVYGNFAQMINFPNNVTQAVAPEYSFLQENNNLIPVASVAPAGDNYNLNFSMSSASNLVGVNSRGTLQSNLQRLAAPSPMDGSSLNLPFFFGPGAPPGTGNGATSAENQFIQFWDGYHRGHHHSDIKEKGKN